MNPLNKNEQTTGVYDLKPEQEREASTSNKRALTILYKPIVDFTIFSYSAKSAQLGKPEQPSKPDQPSKPGQPSPEHPIIPNKPEQQPPTPGDKPKHPADKPKKPVERKEKNSSEENKVDTDYIERQLKREAEERAF